jgi:hypothetical protein
MENQKNAVVELSSVEHNELKTVEGGYLMTVDTTGMPSRDVMCGTIWILNRMPKSFGGRA